MKSLVTVQFVFATEKAATQFLELVEAHDSIDVIALNVEREGDTVTLTWSPNEDRGRFLEGVYHGFAWSLGGWS